MYVVTTIAAVLELDKAIQTVVALANIKDLSKKNVYSYSLRSKTLLLYYQHDFGKDWTPTHLPQSVCLLQTFKL